MKYSCNMPTLQIGNIPQEIYDHFQHLNEIYQLVSKADSEKWCSTQDEDQKTWEDHSDTGRIQDYGSSPGRTIVRVSSGLQHLVPDRIRVRDLK